MRFVVSSVPSTSYENRHRLLWYEQVVLVSGPPYSDSGGLEGVPDGARAIPRRLHLGAVPGDPVVAPGWPPAAPFQRRVPQEPLYDPWFQSIKTPAAQRTYQLKATSRVRRQKAEYPIDR